jgi:hypothetical protein
VKGRAPKTGYSRAQFGPAWTDDVTVPDGHNGCDTRNDVLRRDLTGVTLKPGSNGCVVLTGTLADPYTATSIAFTRGVATSTEVQIDHVVALSNAWQTGAQQLSPAQRVNFANDPRNLQATQGSANEQKSDGDAATWLPANKNYRCTYVARQIEVKAAYRLWVTAPEKSAMERVLSNCNSPSSDPGPTTAQATQPSVVGPPSTSQPTNPPAPSTVSGDTYYRNCSAARAAGAAPLHVGDPGYRSALDRDHDGVACES